MPPLTSNKVCSPKLEEEEGDRNSALLPYESKMVPSINSRIS